MVSIRRAEIDDFGQMQNCNLWCLPENYTARYYYYHFLSWNHLLFVAEDANKKIVGYVLAKIEEESEEKNKNHGHITSISVLRSYRRLGVAQRLMQSTHQAMQEIYNAGFCSLHVRISNRAALGLYKDKLGYEIFELEKGYYADSEDAYSMIKYFIKSERPSILPYEAQLQQKLEQDEEILNQNEIQSKQNQKNQQQATEKQEENKEEDTSQGQQQSNDNQQQQSQQKEAPQQQQEQKKKKKRR